VSISATITAPLDATDLEAFATDGFVLKRAFFTPGQMAALADVLANDEALRRRTFGSGDGTGGAVELALWNAPGDDAFGALARSASMVGAATQLLGDEVYHYHSKLNTKRPGGGGTWVWHQDYGYWYENGCLTPDMLTVAVPLSPMTEANGAVQLMRGSHHAGRIDHFRVGDQVGADPDRVAALNARFETVPFEGEPGDVVFFHCNVLHTSAPNTTDRSRELLLVAYNARRNDPVKAHHHPGYTPIDVVADDEVERRAGRYDGEKRTFMAARQDRTGEKLERIR
jgi:Phytanoyl-CoA dioxygenase (PhyH)